MLAINQTVIEVVRGSVLEQDVDVIVNAANNAMRGGGGVDGAIHLAAGKALVEELKILSPHGCRSGEVVVTQGHALRHKHIFHTPGPIWFGGLSKEPEVLSRCYRNCLVEASNRSLSSIAFCSISTGIYRFPISRASVIATNTVAAWINENPSTSINRVVFAMFQEQEFEHFTSALAALAENPASVS